MVSILSTTLDREMNSLSNYLQRCRQSKVIPGVVDVTDVWYVEGIPSEVVNDPFARRKTVNFQLAESMVKHYNEGRR